MHMHTTPPCSATRRSSVESTAVAILACRPVALVRRDSKRAVLVNPAFDVLARPPLRTISGRVRNESRASGDRAPAPAPPRSWADVRCRPRRAARGARSPDVVARDAVSARRRLRHSRREVAGTLGEPEGRSTDRDGQPLSLQRAQTRTPRLKGRSGGAPSSCGTSRRSRTLPAQRAPTRRPTAGSPSRQTRSGDRRSRRRSTARTHRPPQPPRASRSCYHGRPRE